MRRSWRGRRSLRRSFRKDPLQVELSAYLRSLSFTNIDLFEKGHYAVRLRVDSRYVAAARSTTGQGAGLTAQGQTCGCGSLAWACCDAAGLTRTTRTKSRQRKERKERKRAKGGAGSALWLQAMTGIRLATVKDRPAALSLYCSYPLMLLLTVVAAASLAVLPKGVGSDCDSP